MPSRALSPCSHPGCPEIAVAHGRCAAHQRPRAAEQNRPSARERGYTAEWNRIRNQYLRANPSCEFCGAEARQVHHVVRIEDGGTHDWDNLRAVCMSCHNKITASRRGDRPLKSLEPFP